MSLPLARCGCKPSGLKHRRPNRQIHSRLHHVLIVGQQVERGLGGPFAKAQGCQRLEGVVQALGITSCPSSPALGSSPPYPTSRSAALATEVEEAVRPTSAPLANHLFGTFPKINTKGGWSLAAVRPAPFSRSLA